MTWREQSPGPVPSMMGTMLSADSAEAFYSGAYARIARFMAALGVAATVAAYLRFGWVITAGFALGCAISYVNLFWLKHAISALADRVTQSGRPRSSRGIVLRFLLRYFLIALGAYAIFKISLAGLYGLLAGLFLPVAGIFCEAIYELYAALWREV